MGTHAINMCYSPAINLQKHGKWLLRAWPFHACSTSMVPCVAIPYMPHNKLHKTCMFHVTREHGPRKYATGLFKVLLCYHVCLCVHK